MKNDILKRCPFCGSKGMIVALNGFSRPHSDLTIMGYTPMCTNFDCIAYGNEHKAFKTEEEAVEAWNDRKEIK